MILKGNCIEVLKALKPNSVDAIVTDPPYGLEFMGKEWEKLIVDLPEEKINKQGRKIYLHNGEWKGTGYDGKLRPSGYPNRKVHARCAKCGKRDFSGNPCICEKPEWISEPLRSAHPAMIAQQRWHTQWLTEAYRVLKPGGSMLVMGGTRTFHRLACAIEDSGFIIKDTLMWLYGSGFPKAQDLGKMIDKRMGAKRQDLGANPNKKGRTKCIRGNNLMTPKAVKDCGDTSRITLPSTDLAQHWDGFKVGGIKPAYEPIIWAVKPPEGSYVDNVLKWGVGAVNVDECRVGTEDDCKRIPSKLKKDAISYVRQDEPTFGGQGHSKGRFPANIILSHHPKCVQVGVKRVRGERHSGKPGHGKDGQIYGKGIVFTGNTKCYVDKDGLETVESWDCHSDCPVRILDEQSGESISRGGTPKNLGNDRLPWKGSICETTGGLGDSGGASRFFYCAKASRSERNAGLDDLMVNGKRQEGKEEEDLHWSSGHKNPGSFQSEGTKKKATNAHPTVKPIKLFEWLIRLVTREGQVILDPFLGSGTTAIAAHNAGRKCVGIEKEGEYLQIAKKRIDYWKAQPKQMELK